MVKPTDSRLVWNNSAHIPSLIPILERLCQQDGISTVIRAVIWTSERPCAKNACVSLSSYLWGL